MTIRNEALRLFLAAVALILTIMLANPAETNHAPIRLGSYFVRDRNKPSAGKNRRHTIVSSDRIYR